MTQSHEQPPSSQALARGYEPSDVNVNGLLMFLFFFLLTAIVLHTGLWVLVKYYLNVPRAADQPPSAVPLVQRFPEPELQPSVDHNSLPWEDLAAMRREDDEVFRRLGWKIDPQTQRPLIPPQIAAELAGRQSAAATTQSSREGGR